MPVFSLLAILFLGFASSANALTEAGSPTTTCLYKSAKQLTINPKHAGTIVNTCSSLSCIETHCKAVDNCAVSFHAETGQCLGVSSKVLETLPELSKSGQLFKASKDGWLVIVSGDMEVNKASAAMKAMKAAAFWPLDSKNKGRNLGTKGEVLNMEVPGVDWNSKGPNGSDRKFARFTKKSRAKVPLKKNGELALNMTSFTIAAWIKREDRNIANFFFDESALEISVSSERVVVVRFNQLHIISTYGNYQFSSNTEYSWHHFAIVSEGVKSAATIYVDGKPLKAKIRSKNRSFDRPSPAKLLIGYYKLHDIKSVPQDYLVGGMACLFISEATLKPAEVKQLKNSCP